MRVLVVVDYQNDFVDEKGTLGFKKARDLEPIIYNKVMECIENKDYVYFTKDTHYEETYFGSQEGKNLPIPHCFYDTYGWELYGRLYDVLLNNKLNKRVSVITKDTFGAFSLGSALMDYEYKSNECIKPKIKEIELCGVITNVCVISNAIFLKTLFPETRIVVDSLACASNNDELHEKALDIMESLQIRVINRRMNQIGRNI